jgi:hypothetical protein
MKVILSRKGFDSSYGGQPSPILPDGTLLSLPIPSKNDNILYSDLVYNNESYWNIIKELKPNTKIKKKSKCHLDPDIDELAIPREKNWKGLFGQSNSAQGHLKNNNVRVGDIFLFFGWFKQTELKNNKLQYKKGSPDLHIIYGFLEIGALYSNYQLPERIKYHPHTDYFNKKHNCIYEASDKLSLNKQIPGYGTFKYNESIVLTKEGESRSHWDLPDFFKDVKISYHTPKSFENDYFNSAKRGQEFVIDANEKIIKWTNDIINRGYIKNK